MNLSTHDFTIVWLDANNTQFDAFFDRPSILTSIISDLHVFDNVPECLQYIASIHSNVLVFLLVSGHLAQNLLPELENHSKICYVYIYCANREYHETWTKNYAKVRGVYVDRITLLNQLTADVALYSKELSAPITLFKRDDLIKKERSIQSLSKESATFMWLQLLIETLLQSKQTIHARNDFLNECKRECKDNSAELNNIQEFDINYSPNEAIRWYTRPCFLFRLLNQAMRTQDIETIYKYRWFILDLHKQLCFLNATALNVSEVYRGQLMGFEEIEQMRANINGLISINAYFSTSISSDVASRFSGDGLRRSNLESVIFTIKIHPNMTDKPFAKIEEYSYLPNEGEVLFSVGTVFRILDVGELTVGVWSIELELSSDVQEKWYDVMLYLRTEMTGRPTLMTLGNFLSEMGDLDKSEKHYRLLKNELENDEDTGAILTAIAGVHFRKADYTRALDFCTQGLEQLTALTYTHPDLATAYNLMGMIHFEMDQFNVAIQHYESALKIHEKTLSHNDPLIAADLNNIASVDVKLHQFDVALKRFNRCLDIKQSVLPPDHPLIGHTYVNLGLLYAEQNKWTDAHYFYDKAIALQLKTLPATHPDIAISYASKAHVLIQEKKFDCALELCEKARDIQLKRFPLCTNHLTNIYEQIGFIYLHTENFTEAIRSFERALEYGFDCHALWNQLCQLHNHLGVAYYKNEDNSKALREYMAALDLIPTTDRSCKRFSTLNNIATAHLNMANFSIALEFYQQMIIALDHVDSPPANTNLVSAYKNIGLCYLATDDNDLALESFARVLSLTEDPTRLSDTHYHLGDIFLQKHEFDNSVKSYELALKYDSSNEDFVIMTHKSIAIAHGLSGDYEKVLGSFQQLLSIQLATDSIDNSELATTYGNIADIYRQAGDLNEAINQYTKQLEFETDENIKRQITEDIVNIRQSLQENK